MIKAMVLAAGVGSRLDPISQYIPKPLVPVLNVPVITNILHGLKKHGVTEVVSNTHYLAEALAKHFQTHPPEGMNIKFLKEEELSGDAGGVRACKQYLMDDTFIVIMGDLITNANLGSIVKAHKAKGAIATIGVKKMTDVSRFGVMKRDANGFIQAFQEKPKPEEAISNEISTGIYILEPEVFKHIPDSGVYGFGKQLFPSLVEKGLPVLGEEIDGQWSDIGTLKDLYRANMDALAGKVKLFCDPEKGALPLNNVRLGERVLLGKNVTIGDGTVVGNNVIIGDDCVIGKNVTLGDCVIFGDSQIPDGSVLEKCIYAYNEHIPMEQREALAAK